MYSIFLFSHLMCNQIMPLVFLLVSTRRRVDHEKIMNIEFKPQISKVWPWALLIIMAEGRRIGNWSRLNSNGKSDGIIGIQGMSTSSPSNMVASITLFIRLFTAGRVPLQSWHEIVSDNIRRTVRSHLERRIVCLNIRQKMLRLLCRSRDQREQWLWWRIQCRLFHFFVRTA